MDSSIFSLMGRHTNGLGSLSISVSHHVKRNLYKVRLQFPIEVNEGFQSAA